MRGGADTTSNPQSLPPLVRRGVFDSFSASAAGPKPGLYDGKARRTSTRLRRPGEAGAELQQVSAPPDSAARRGGRVLGRPGAGVRAGARAVGLRVRSGGGPVRRA